MRGLLNSIECNFSALTLANNGKTHAQSLRDCTRQAFTRFSRQFPSKRIRFVAFDA